MCTVASVLLWGLLLLAATAAGNVWPAFSYSAPGGMPNSSAPQFVLLTFDDYIQDPSINQIVSSGLYAVTPGQNSCPLRWTFYTAIAADTAEKMILNNCNAVLDMFNRGHEIAAHTYSHTRRPALADINEGIDYLVNVCGVPREEIRGFRFPYLDYTQDTFDNVNQQPNLLYDATLISFTPYGQFPWPHKLDSGIILPCWTGTCTGAPVPGLIEVPMYRMASPVTQQFVQSMDYSEPGVSVADLMNFNLNLHLNTNRAPMGIHLHTPWLVQGPAGNTNGQQLSAWIQSIMLTRSDVHFVTTYELVQWLNNPQPFSQYTRPGCGAAPGTTTTTTTRATATTTTTTTLPVGPTTTTTTTTTTRPPTTTTRAPTTTTTTRAPTTTTTTTTTCPKSVIYITPATHTTVECNSSDAVQTAARFQQWLRTRGGATASTSCCRNSTVTWSHGSVQPLTVGVCDDIRNVTFVARDECNSTAQISVTYRVQDTVQPVFVATGIDITVPCTNYAEMNAQYRSWIQSRANSSCRDACSASLTLTDTSENTPNLPRACGQVAVVMFGCADSCGLTSSVWRSVRVPAECCTNGVLSVPETNETTTTTTTASPTTTRRPTTASTTTTARTTAGIPDGGDLTSSSSDSLLTPINIGLIAAAASGVVIVVVALVIMRRRAAAHRTMARASKQLDMEWIGDSARSTALRTNRSLGLARSNPIYGSVEALDHNGRRVILQLDPDLAYD